jgi:hypothetical protein
MFHACPVKIITMQASSRPALERGKSATSPSTSPGKNPSTGIDWSTSSSGTSTRAAAALCAAAVP